MTNVRSIELPQWRRLAERPENRCLIPLTELCEWTPDKHDLGDGKPPLKGEMWFQVTDQPRFAVAGFWQRTKDGDGFTIVTCEPNELVAPIDRKTMITILHEADWERWLTPARGRVDVPAALSGGADYIARAGIPDAAGGEQMTHSCG